MFSSAGCISYWSLLQGRRRVLKSGTAIERLWPSAEGTSGGEHERGFPPLVRGIRGETLEKVFKFKLYVEAILMHFEAILLLKLDLLDRHDMKLYSNVFHNPPLKYEQLFRPLDTSHQTHNLKGYIQNLVRTREWFLRKACFNFHT